MSRPDAGEVPSSPARSIALVDELEKNQLEYALCGGLAVGMLGHDPATKDLGIIVRQEDRLRSAAAVESSKIATSSVNLMTVSPCLEAVWHGRIQIEWRGRNVTIAPREGLEKTKKPAALNRTPVDMSPEAVDLRIRDLSDLWDFWSRLELDRQDGKLVGPEVRAESELKVVRATALEAAPEPPRP